MARKEKLTIENDIHKTRLCVCLINDLCRHHLYVYVYKITILYPPPLSVGEGKNNKLKEFIVVYDNKEELLL